MSNNFDELVRLLPQYQHPVDTAFLHGLLTGCATIPTVNYERLFDTIAPKQPLPEDAVESLFDSIDQIAEALSVATFEARFDIHRKGEAQGWLKGYLQAVAIHEKDWQALNEVHTDAAASLVALNTMSDARLHRELQMDMPGPKDLERHPELISNLAANIYDHFHEPEDSVLDLDEDETVPWFDFDDEELAEMDEELLVSVVTSSDDDLPLNVVLECGRRGDAVVPLLQQHLENEAHWKEDADESDWWGLLHSIYILGLIPGKASAHALLNAFQRVTCDGNNNLSDWVSGYWPALFRNKTEYTTAPLRQIAESREAGWYARAEATDCVLAAAAADGVDALEQAVDWLATVSSDTTEDDHFRVIAGQSLLDFPRERYRPLMEALVDLQRAESPMVRSYDRDDIQKAFDKGDDPEWERFADPWKFYDPDEIERRQTRWAREAGEPYEDRPISTQPYKREAPKTGRNDPCPCGSGKKYKKCCLIAAE